MYEFCPATIEQSPRSLRSTSAADAGELSPFFAPIPWMDMGERACMLNALGAGAISGRAPGVSAAPADTLETPLERLLSDVARAVENSQLPAALRLADRAWRMAPRDPIAVLLCARLLVMLGRAPQALGLLKNREEPEAIVLRGEALCSLQLLDEASQACRRLLHKFALDSVEGLAHLASGLCRRPVDSRYPGWIGVDNRLHLIGQVRSAAPLEIRISNRICEPLTVVDLEDGNRSFEFDLPRDVSGEVTARSADSFLLGSGLRWPPDFDLYAWAVLEEGMLSGEARLGWSPAHFPPIAIGASEEPGHPQAVRTAASDRGRSTFSISLNERERDCYQLEVAAILPDGSLHPIVGSPIFKSHRLAEPVGSRPDRSLSKTVQSGPRLSRDVDVVVTVYGNYHGTLACIESLLASTLPEGTEIVVVDDATPDPHLREALIGLARDHRITLLTNLRNLGFPGAANKGMRLHPAKDVVLLNSDTEVFGDWLERMRHAAYSADDIGTVTPLCETDSITAYPWDAEASDKSIRPVDIDRIAREVNAGTTVDLPVGVGFCLYLRRDCLNEIGELDETSFGKGYGEEADLCLRARKLGWRSVASADVFVSHDGGRSYGKQMKELSVIRNGRILSALHPGYASLVEEFFATDPLLSARRAVDMMLLRERADSPVLLMTLSLPGGVEKHVSERQAKLAASGHTVLVLRPAESDGAPATVNISVASLGMKSLSFDVPRDLDLLRGFLHSLDLSSIEIHHFLETPAPILELAVSLGVPYDAYVHDYVWICPRVTLIGGSGQYCGEPPVSACEDCIRMHGSGLESSLTVEGLRTRSSRILGAARRVVAPSQDTRQRLAGYFPDLEVDVVPWESGIQSIPRTAVTAVKGSTRVAIIGAIGIQKGYQVLLDCARDAARRDLDIEFVVIGYTHDDQSLLGTGKVFITGLYHEGEVDELLGREQCNVAFFPSVWPETWCYSLTHAISWGLPVLSYDHGAQAERLRAYGAAELVPLSATAESLNDSLIRLASEPAFSTRQKEIAMDQTLSAIDAPSSEELTSSVQILTLPEGVYSFTIESGGGDKNVLPSDIVLPALHLSLAPTKTSARVEFRDGASVLDHWLAYDTDMIVVRIIGGDASLMLTSVRRQDSAVLDLHVDRLNAEPVFPDAASIPAPTHDGAPSPLPQVQLRTHIQNVGDLEFLDCWAGWPGKHLWIEAFSISVGGLIATDSLQPDAAVECRAVMADGSETPWLNSPELCGSRGAGMPILAFALRMNGELADKYECAYSGKFFSGATVGPLKNGESCSSALPADPLEAISVVVTERQVEHAIAQDAVQSYSLER